VLLLFKELTKLSTDTRFTALQRGTVSQLAASLAVLRLTSATDHSSDETKGVVTGDCADM